MFFSEIKMKKENKTRKTIRHWWRNFKHLVTNWFISLTTTRTTVNVMLPLALITVKWYVGSIDDSYWANKYRNKPIQHRYSIYALRSILPVSTTNIWFGCSDNMITLSSFIMIFIGVRNVSVKLSICPTLYTSELVICYIYCFYKNLLRQLSLQQDNCIT